MFIPPRNLNEKTAVISFEEFFQKYEGYISSLKEGKIPEEKSLRRYFSSVFTTTPDILYAIKVGEEKYLIKSLKPIVQLQAHQFFVSTIDQKVHPMVLGKDSITWGMQFSYPQIFQSPKSQDFFKVDTSEQFPNTVLFTNLVRWIRRNTTPTPLVIEGKKTFVPIRVGKKCMSWIHVHPQLLAKKIQIASLEGVND
jgi:hypothetical protein